MCVCVCVRLFEWMCKCKAVRNEVIFIRPPCPPVLSRPQIQFVCRDRDREIVCVCVCVHVCVHVCMCVCVCERERESKREREKEKFLPKDSHL